MSLTYQQEFLATFQPAGQPLVERHWAEARKDPSGPSVDWDAYRKLEEYGALRVFTARDDSRLLGYAAFVLSPDLHKIGRKNAICDGVFFERSFRNGASIKAFMSFCESCLTEDGADRIRIGANAGTRLCSLLEHFGYKFVEAVYEKAS